MCKFILPNRTHRRQLDFWPRTIQQAQADPDDVKLSAGVRLLRQRQLRRGDVQQKLGAISEQRVSRGGRCMTLTIVTTAPLCAATLKHNEHCELADRINNLHEACCRAVHDTLVNAMAAGDLLLQAKADCKHGEWSDGSKRTSWVLIVPPGSTCGSPSTGKASSPKRQRLPFQGELTIAKGAELIAPKQEKVVEPDPGGRTSPPTGTRREHRLGRDTSSQRAESSRATARLLPRGDSLQQQSKLPTYGQINWLIR